MTQGKGTFVCSPEALDAVSRKDKAMAAIDTLFEELEALGFTPREMEIYINLRLQGLEERYDLVKVAAIDCNPETLQLMEDQLSQINYVQAAIFSLAQIPELADKLNNDYDVILTTSTHYGEVEPFIHANIALRALQELDLQFPVFGMVKDDRHRTRALVTPEGQEIRIDHNPAIFSLIGNIQDETHRFAITYHRKLRSKRLQYSELDGIVGIGPKRKQELLRQFKSLTAIRGATLPELERILPRDAAAAVYHHFRKTEENQEA